MGDLTNIKVNPFKGNTIEMLQDIIRALEAGRTYNPLAHERINKKIDEIEHAICAIAKAQKK